MRSLKDRVDEVVAALQSAQNYGYDAAIRVSLSLFVSELDGNPLVIL